LGLASLSGSVRLMAAAFTKKLPGMIINREKKSENVKVWTVLYEYFIRFE